MSGDGIRVESTAKALEPAKPFDQKTGTGYRHGQGEVLALPALRGEAQIQAVSDTLAHVVSCTVDCGESFLACRPRRVKVHWPTSSATGYNREGLLGTNEQ